MRAHVKLPKLGDTANEAIVIEWLVEIGSVVAEGEPLVAVQTDKVDVEVPSPVSGTLVERLVDEDEEVGVGSPIAVVEL